ncbi:nuclear transport factor 2 family protein [Embleya sp. NBC_00896]|uniref:nuclear transport factor 2 family protein n=1 Tax=Embleya sp. NBC_00896 TaxID=2975961 RepID=UPI00386B51C9|nr:nuclear transport factor 2 family protein [Embleya sp. NBC_00896]
MVVLAEDGRIRHDVQLAVATDPTPGTRAVVDEFLRRLVGGDPEHVAELFAEKVDWRLDWPADGHPATPWIRPRSTRAEVAAHFRELAAVHTPHPDPAPGSPPHTVVEGPHAVVLAELRHTAKPTGKPYTAHCAVHITVEAGHITRYHVYEDSLSVAQAHTADA